jgi:phosphinothricin acetyltransferase
VAEYAQKGASSRQADGTRFFRIASSFAFDTVFIMTVRDATEADLPAIVAIYNAAIPGRTATADTEPVTVDERRGWFAEHEPTRRPLWVAERDGEVIAWIGLSSFYCGRAAYDATAEVSMYIAPAHQSRGLGRDLMQRMIAACPRLGVTTLLAMYFDHNEASRRLCASLGFEPAGHLQGIAQLDGLARGLIIAALRIESK